MLTAPLLSYYNHLLATTVLYLTIVDPIQELTKTYNSLLLEGHRDYSFSSVVLAEIPDNDQDYYEILGLKKNATKHEINKAFRQLAKKYHPDKNKEKGAQEEFMKIFKAYKTLSDDEKRKEYDNRSSGNSAFNNWQSNGMNDFNMHDFFKQYEDQLFRHSQHFNHHHNDHRNHHSNNHQFSFHGVNLDELFHDIDDDEFLSFGRIFDGFSPGHNHFHHQDDSDGTFGDGASFFGTHFSSQIHDTLHNYQHHQTIYNSGGHSGSYPCHTVTKQVNGVLMTQTSCG